MRSLKPTCFFILFLSALGRSGAQKGADNCMTTRCSTEGPEIRFPFWLNKGEQSSSCGIAGFEVSCKGSETRLHLPPNVNEVLLRDIDYKNGSLKVFPIDSCMDGLFFDLNLSATPFQYNVISTWNSTFFNCSKVVNGALSTYCPPVQCMSGSGYSICNIDSDQNLDYVPVSCTKVKTIKYPFWSFFSWDSLDLKWDQIPACRDCEYGGGKCTLKNRTTGQVGCFYPPPPSNRGKKRKKFLIIGLSIWLFGSLLAIIVALKAYNRFKERKLLEEDQHKVEQFLENYKALRPTRYSYAEIRRMTNNFRHKLGEGGYGTVFKGKLPNGILVAVKLLQHIGGDGDEFTNEVGAMGRIHHVNVVRLLGFCAEKFKRALIYEFMPNESLEKFIFSRGINDTFLGWKKLEQIGIGIAKGIDYLHTGCNRQILHFDIKPQNVLLDDNFNPKISDFGLAKLCAKGQSVVSMTAARGTMGYMAPEVFSRNFGNVSHKSDIYSFGMLLLEMVGGRKNIDPDVENTSQVYFPEWAYDRLDQGGELGLEITDEEDGEIAKKLTIVALWCIQWYPVDRPSMKNVVQMLEGSGYTVSMPPNPFDSKNGNDKKAIKPIYIELPVIAE